MLSKYNINIENCCFLACFRLLIFIHFSRGSADSICPYMRTPRGLSRLLTRSAVFADDVVPSVGDVAESTVSRQVGHRQRVLADHQNSTDDRHTNTQTDTTDCCTPQTTDTPTHRDGHDRLLHSTDDECTDRDDGDGHEDAVGGRVASKSADRPAQTTHVARR